MHFFLIAAACSLVVANVAFAATPDSAKHPVFIIKTNLGDIKLQLDAEKAPESVENFRRYAEKGHYKGTIFHRVIPDFMIQGGGFTADMTQKPTSSPIKNEAKNGLENKRGSIAMARTGVVDSATSQFFINTVDNPGLNYRGPGPAYGYAVFGQVTDGMKVVDAIRKVKTGSKSMHQDVPLEPVTILDVVEVK
jgi:cyclophilin family peptidyl-prolyl cis-trans isomerase